MKLAEQLRYGFVPHQLSIHILRFSALTAVTVLLSVAAGCPTMHSTAHGAQPLSWHSRLHSSAPAQHSSTCSVQLPGVEQEAQCPGLGERRAARCWKGCSGPERGLSRSDGVILSPSFSEYAVDKKLHHTHTEGGVYLSIFTLRFVLKTKQNKNHGWK